ATSWTRSPGPTTLSYTALAQYMRCGYRFYVERVLGLPAVEASASGGGAELTGAERGIAVHGLLERIDFRRVALPDDDAVTAAAGRPLSEASAAEIRGLI